MLNYTVMALGNHDFDDGTAGLQPFVDQVISNSLTLSLILFLKINYPMIAANVHSSQLENVEASTVVNLKGRKVREYS